MTTTVDDEWESQNLSRWARRYQTILFDICGGIVIGLITGMAAFIDEWSDFVGVPLGTDVFLVPLVAGAALGYLIAPDMRRSFRIAGLGFLVGIAVLIGIYVLPAYILPYAEGPRSLLVPQFVGDALSIMFYSYAPLYLGSYLLTLSIFSVLD